MRVKKKTRVFKSINYFELETTSTTTTNNWLAIFFIDLFVSIYRSYRKYTRVPVELLHKILI